MVALRLPQPGARGCFEADSSSGGLTGFGAGTRPAEEKLHIRALGSDLKDDTEFAAAGDGALHTAAGFRMGVCL